MLEKYKQFLFPWKWFQQELYCCKETENSAKLLFEADSLDKKFLLFSETECMEGFCLS